MQQQRGEVETGGWISRGRELKEGVVLKTLVARPELDINLNPGDPSHSGGAPGFGLRTQIRVIDWLWADCCDKRPYLSYGRGLD